MEKISIELINGKWHVNGNTFRNMSEAERIMLDSAINAYKLEIEGAFDNEIEKKENFDNELNTLAS
jgi:hypothetical protein